MIENDESIASNNFVKNPHPREKIRLVYTNHFVSEYLIIKRHTAFIQGIRFPVKETVSMVKF